MERPEVKTLSGQVRGLKQISVEGIGFYAFKGIPYAKPPVGELRFKDPVPIEPWQEVREATEFGPMAAQFDVISKFSGGSDDCLYINVYTKKINSNVKQPVMFYIHGGGFIFGSGNDFFYGPDFLMRKDIVLVTFNYRLGVFGFLNLEHEVAPGNQGLKDQVMALKWVRDNIANFGGDSENVTIFGESAGGASVHYLTVSPLAKGLFHKAISQSGVFMNPWASVSGEPRKKAYELCELLGKKTTDPVEIVKFLRTVDTMKLIEHQGELQIQELQKKCLSAFVPGVDDKSPNPFMPFSREVAVEQAAHVPYLIGYNDREGTLLYKIFENDDFESKNLRFEEFIHPNFAETLKRKKISLEDLKRMYFKNKKISKETTGKFIDLFSDMYFIQGIHQVARVQAERNSAPTYMYQFTYDQGPNFSKGMFSIDEPGSTHMDELIYLFSMKFQETLNMEPIDKKSPHFRVMEQMVELWTNFAKYGRPIPAPTELLPVHWLPMNDGTVLRYLNIGEELRMEKVLNIEERYDYKLICHREKV
uniref:Carboxylic ester hydrolase n=1 Tax=Anisopteromalus calandrae TaxID=76800 RepID=O61726_9HYME|nr:carboxylesterase [Anisopteromalus calandrae]